jgi:hypothetical protein
MLPPEMMAVAVTPTSSVGAGRAIAVGEIGANRQVCPAIVDGCIEFPPWNRCKLKVDCRFESGKLR